MPSANSLTETQEAVLFAIWKLRGIGTNPLTEDQLKTQMANGPTEALPQALTELQSQGFVQVENNGGRKTVAITPLGLAILRKVEEDRLQEV